MGIVIRHLGPDDADVLGSVADEVFDAPVDPKRAATFLVTPDHMLVVAVADGVVVGQCVAMIHRHVDQSDELYIDNLGVAEDHRRGGVAMQLLDRMLEIGRKAGCRTAWVGTEIGNVPARLLYEKRGGKSEPFMLYGYEL